MNWITLGSLFGFLGVLLGAFGAHALKSRLSPEMMAIFEVAVRYQLVHALALLGVGLAEGRAEPRGLRIAGGGFALGTLIFSGSLYLLIATGVRGWGAVTPLGGLSFMTGWLALAWAARAAGRRGTP